MDTGGIRKQIEKWRGDRHIIGLKAVRDIKNDGNVEIITIVEGDELMGIATLRDNELLNLATKHSGYGIAMLEKIARYGIENDTYIESVSTDDSVGFYCKTGWEIEGYPGDNQGVIVNWGYDEMVRFVSDERDALLAESAQVYREYVEFLEENLKEMKMTEKVEQIKNKLHGKATDDTTVLIIEPGGQQDNYGPCIVEIAILDDDGDTVAYRYSDDGLDGKWVVGSIEDLVASVEGD